MAAVKSSSTGSNAVTLVELKHSLVPSRWEDTVRTVGIAEYREAAVSLAHAFATDDYAKYLLTSDDMAGLCPEEKWKLHVDIMAYAVASHYYDGLVTTIGPDYDSVALWVPPGKSLNSWWTVLRSGMWRLYFQLTPEAKKRYFDEVIPLLHDTKAEVLGDREDDAWYLAFIGTKPNARGRGYAKKLLDDMIQKADADNRLVYLESSSAANNAYYKKFGFEAKREIFLKRGRMPVCLTIMVRDPRPLRKVAYPSTIKKFQLVPARTG
ncbi:N-acetyltransferase-like protein [Thozetella sp. PMI_491]|nr:N-acetyltransferase-like protein [Thozetella sp. PMI_491]